MATIETGSRGSHAVRVLIGRSLKPARSRAWINKLHLTTYLQAIVAGKANCNALMPSTWSFVNEYLVFFWGGCSSSGSSPALRLGIALHLSWGLLCWYSCKALGLSLLVVFGRDVTMHAPVCCCCVLLLCAAAVFIELWPYDETSAALNDKVAGLIAWSIPMIEATN